MDVKRCIWCSSTLQRLEEGKPYCIQCAENCFRECKRCHRPFDDSKYFLLDKDRCNACQRKYSKEKMSETDCDNESYISDSSISVSNLPIPPTKKLKLTKPKKQIDKEKEDKSLSKVQKAKPKTKRKRTPKTSAKSEHFDADTIIKELVGERAKVKTVLSNRKVGFIPVFI